MATDLTSSPRLALGKPLERAAVGLAVVLIGLVAMGLCVYWLKVSWVAV